MSYLSDISVTTLRVGLEKITSSSSGTLNIPGGLVFTKSSGAITHISISPTGTFTSMVGFAFSPSATLNTAGASITGIMGNANAIMGSAGSPVTTGTLYGLSFQANAVLGAVVGNTMTILIGVDVTVRGGFGLCSSARSLTITDLMGMHLKPTTSITLISNVDVDLAVTTFTGLKITAALGNSVQALSNQTIGTFYGIRTVAVAVSNASIVVTDAYGLRIEDITGTSFTNKYLIEFGSSTPTTTSGLFRMMGNFTAAANQTPVYISEGATPTVRQLQTKAGNTLVAGDLVCVLV